MLLHPEDAFKGLDRAALSSWPPPAQPENSRSSNVADIVRRVRRSHASFPLTPALPMNRTAGVPARSKHKPAKRIKNWRVRDSAVLLRPGTGAVRSFRGSRRDNSSGWSLLGRGGEGARPGRGVGSRGRPRSVPPNNLQVGVVFRRESPTLRGVNLHCATVCIRVSAHPSGRRLASCPFVSIRG